MLFTFLWATQTSLLLKKFVITLYNWQGKVKALEKYVSSYCGWLTIRSINCILWYAALNIETPTFLTLDFLVLMPMSYKFSKNFQQQVILKPIAEELISSTENKLQSY